MFFAYDTTAVLSWYEQIFVAMWFVGIRITVEQIFH